MATNDSSTDVKRKALREQGCLNSAPRDVTDPVFRGSEFFDPEDLVQVKYEMLRRVEVDGQSVSSAVQGFGFSRPTFYEAQRALDRAGLPGLVPRKRGPRGAHKLTDEVLAFVDQERETNPGVSTTTLVSRIEEHFELEVHRRSLERALARREKKR